MTQLWVCFKAAAIALYGRLVFSLLRCQSWANQTLAAQIEIFVLLLLPLLDDAYVSQRTNKAAQARKQKRRAILSFSLLLEPSSQRELPIDSIAVTYLMLCGFSLVVFATERRKREQE